MREGTGVGDAGETVKVTTTLTLDAMAGLFIVTVTVPEPEPAGRTVRTVAAAMQLVAVMALPTASGAADEADRPLVRVRTAEPFVAEAVAVTIAAVVYVGAKVGDTVGADEGLALGLGVGLSGT